MHIKTKIAALLGIAALMLAPTSALAVGGPEYAPEKPPKPKPLPGPGASTAEKTKAYGIYCAGFSKKLAKGQSATRFGLCLNAMATAAKTPKTAQIACKVFPKTHVAGQKGTEFTRCVVAASKVKRKAAATR